MPLTPDRTELITLWHVLFFHAKHASARVKLQGLGCATKKLHKTSSVKMPVLLPNLGL
jgi:hypothetical protein